MSFSFLFVSKCNIMNTLKYEFHKFERFTCNKPGGGGGELFDLGTIGYIEPPPLPRTLDLIYFVKH